MVISSLPPTNGQSAVIQWTVTEGKQHRSLIKTDGVQEITAWPHFPIASSTVLCSHIRNFPHCCPDAPYILYFSLVVTVILLLI